VIQTL